MCYCSSDLASRNSQVDKVLLQQRKRTKDLALVDTSVQFSGMCSYSMRLVRCLIEHKIFCSFMQVFLSSFWMLFRWCSYTLALTKSAMWSGPQTLNTSCVACSRKLWCKLGLSHSLNGLAKLTMEQLV